MKTDLLALLVRVDECLGTSDRGPNIEARRAQVHRDVKVAIEEMAETLGPLAAFPPARSL